VPEFPLLQHSIPCLPDLLYFSGYSGFPVKTYSPQRHRVRRDCISNSPLSALRGEFSSGPVTARKFAQAAKTFIHSNAEFAGFGESFNQEIVYSGSAVLSPSPAFHHSNTPLLHHSSFLYLSIYIEQHGKCISGSIVFTGNHWHGTPHCGRSWRF